MINAPALAGDN